MKILRFKITLFAFVGIFLYISHMMIYHEITANSNFPFFSALFFLLFMALWTGIGVLISPFKQDEKPLFLFPLLCLAPAALLSLIAIQLLTTCCPVENYTNLALVAFTGCFPMGLMSGIMLVSAKNSLYPQVQKHVAFFGAMGYFATGFVLYPLDLFNVLTNPAVYIFTCNGLILIVAIAVFRFKRAYSIRNWFLTFATFIIALNFSLSKLETYTVSRFFSVRYEGWKLIKPYLTHHGRISLLSQGGGYTSSRFMVVKNTKIQQIIPDDCQQYKTTVIPFTLQPDKKDLTVLAVGSPFSFIPTMLGSLPYVKEVTMVAPARNSMPLNILRYFSPPPSSKVELIDMDVNQYLKDNTRKFDLIIWLSPGQEYLNFSKMITLCALSMRKGGVMAVPASLLAVNNAQSSCRKIFKNMISLPGKSLVYAFSNAPLTSDLHVLEKRLAKLDTGEVKLFPPGTFSIIYSIPRKMSALTLPSNRSGIENRLINTFSTLKFNLKHILIIFAISCVYFIGRFFILRRKKMQAVTGLFENGLCIMLLMMILTTLYARQEGAFYYNFGTILTIISGIPMGIGLSQFKLQRLAVLTSVVVIFLSSLHFWEYQSCLIPGIAYINFVCGGIIIANIFKQNPDAGVKLLSVHFLSCALGAALMFTLLIMRFNLMSSLFIIVLFRIPLIFSKMALGKLDISGENNA